MKDLWLQVFSYSVYLLGGYFLYHILQKQIQTVIFSRSNRNINLISQSSLKNTLLGVWMSITHVSFDSFLSHLLVMTNTGYLKARDFISLWTGGLFVVMALNLSMTQVNQMIDVMPTYYLLPVALLFPIPRLRPWIKTIFLTFLFYLVLKFFSANLFPIDEHYWLLLFPLFFPSFLFWPFVFALIQLHPSYVLMALGVSIFSLLFYRLFSTAKGNTQQKRILTAAFLLWLGLLPTLYFIKNHQLWTAYAYSFGVLILTIPFYPVYRKVSAWIIREKNYKEANELRWIEAIGMYHVSYFAEILFLETKKKAALVLTMLDQVRTAFAIEAHDVSIEKKLHKYEKITDSMQSEIIRFTECLMRYQMSSYSAEKLRAILRISSELESMADSCITLFKMLQHVKILSQNPDYHQKMKDYLEKTVNYYEQVFDELQSKGFFERDMKMTKTSMQLAMELNEIRKSLYLVIEKGDLSSPLAGYAVEWNAHIKKLKGHISNIYQAHQGIR
jgi:hypothetical protein